MATIVDLMQSYDQSSTNDTWYAEGIMQISPVDTPLILLLPKLQVGSVYPGWIEDSLISQVSAVAATITGVAVALEITAADATAKFPNDVATYQVEIMVDTEHMLVTALVGSNTLTVTRGYGSTTTAAHNVGAVVHIISQLELEGAASKKGFANARSTNANYIQTFRRTVEVTRIQEAVNKLGGVTSEMDYQIAQANKALMLELEKTLILGVAAQAGNGSSTFRTMAGLQALVTSNKTSDSGSVDETALQADFLSIFNEGGVPRAIVTTGAMAQGIANIYKDRIRTDLTTQLGGVNITSIVDPLGGDAAIPIIPHRMMPAGWYFILDTSRMGLMYVEAFHQKPANKDIDGEAMDILGDYTLELANEKSCAFRYGFS